MKERASLIENPNTKICLVQMGQYSVIKRSSGLSLATLGVSTCIAAILESPTHIGLLHIDAPQNLENIIAKMVTEMGGNITKVELVGGYYSPYSPADYSLLPTQLTDIFKKQYGITPEHKNYTVNRMHLIMPSLYLASWAMELLGPESSLSAFIIAGGLYITANLCQAFLTNNLFNLVVSASGKNNIRRNDNNDMREILERFRLQSQSSYDTQNDYLIQRTKMDPTKKMPEAKQVWFDNNGNLSNNTPTPIRPIKSKGR